MGRLQKCVKFEVRKDIIGRERSWEKIWWDGRKRRVELVYYQTQYDVARDA